MVGLPYHNDYGYSDIAKRIREERISLGFEDSPQGEKTFCEKFGLNRQRQRALESESDLRPLNKKVTTAELADFAHAGMDIQYILSGIPSTIRDPKEASLIDNYRRCSAENQQHLEAVSTAFKEQEPQPDWFDLTGQ